MAGYLGNAPSAVPLTSADITDGIITSAKIADGTIVNADINASAAIDASKLTGLSSDYVLLATTDASSSASVSFDGYFSSTYKNYKVILSNVVPSVNTNEALKIRYRRSNADVTASNYKAIGTWESIDGSGSATSSYSMVNNDSSCAIATCSTTTSGYGMSGDLILYNPLNTTQYKIFISQTVASDTGGTPVMVHHKKGGYLLDSQNALSGISFFFNSGNIASGNFKLYGIK